MLPPGKVDTYAGDIFLPELVPFFVEGYEAGASYVMCNGRDSDWRKYYNREKGVTGC